MNPARVEGSRAKTARLIQLPLLHQTNIVALSETVERATRDSEDLGREALVAIGMFKHSFDMLPYRVFQRQRRLTRRSPFRRPAGRLAEF